jgi:hypothetical protein
MHWLRLPEPRRDIAPAFTDPESARVWLATLADKSPLAAGAALLEQIQAVDGAPLQPGETVAQLDALRAAVVPLQAALRERFTRKALPLLSGEERAFDVAYQLWTRLGIAYLRAAPQCTPPERCLPLHRAATAFRLAQYCHYLAARTCPALVDHLLLAVLAAAEANGVLSKPVADPDFPQHGKGSISGELAWAFLLRRIDPYHLSGIGLQVINRVFSRWRELVNFQAKTPDGPPIYTLDLGNLFGSGLPPGIPLYLNLRPVVLKLAQRIKLLEDGESPETLKLGRALSATAATRLLRDVERHLYPHKSAAGSETNTIELIFGGENAYAVLTNRILNAASGHGDMGNLVNREKMAIFGLEQASQLPSNRKRLKVAGEAWTFSGDLATRTAQSSATRLIAPCLVAALLGGRPRLGVLSALRCHPDGALSAQLRWYEDGVRAGSLKRLAPRGEKLVRVPAFLLRNGNSYALIVPAEAGTRLGVAVELADLPVAELMPEEVVERGQDFIHYNCTVK